MQARVHPEVDVYKFLRVLVFITAGTLLASLAWARGESEAQTSDSVRVRTSVQLAQAGQVHSTNEMRSALGEAASFYFHQPPMLKVSVRVDEARSSGTQFEAFISIALDDHPARHFVAPVPLNEEVQSVVTVLDVRAVFRILASSDRPPGADWRSTNVPTVEAAPVQ